MTRAKLPEALMQPPEPVLSSCQVGDTVFLTPSTMMINAGRDCFLAPSAKVSLAKSKKHTLRATRMKDGFHVAILAPYKWELWDLSTLIDKWLPVISLTEEYDEELAQEKADAAEAH